MGGGPRVFRVGSRVVDYLKIPREGQGESCRHGKIVARSLPSPEWDRDRRWWLVRFDDGTERQLPEPLLKHEPPRRRR